MALPVTIPNTFANATASIPLSQLDTNFNTLANAVNGISDGSESLANVSVTGGTISNVAVSATTLNTSGAVVFNDAGADVDFRVEGDTDANLLFVDAGNDRVGIGTSSPTTKLNIAGANVADIQYRSTRQEVPPSSSRTFYSALGGAYSTGTTEVDSAFISFATDGAWSSTSAPSRIAFGTTPSGSTTFAERARFTSDGYLRMASGSGGIQFGGDTAAANALDDYEEGTWTPTLADGFSSAPTGYTRQSGSYTKIGRYVYFQLDLDPDGATANANTIVLGGLPFTSINSGTGGFGGANISYQQSFNTNAADAYHISLNSTGIVVYDDGGVGRAGNAAGVNINTRIILFGCYQAA